jgi:hypothetical protein
MYLLCPSEMTALTCSEFVKMTKTQRREEMQRSGRSLMNGIDKRLKLREVNVCIAAVPEGRIVLMRVVCKTCNHKSSIPYRLSIRRTLAMC